MFTGIVTAVGCVSEAATLASTLRRLRIETPFDADGIALGASIACAGPCLTVVAKGSLAAGSWFEADCAAETLERTTAGRWQPGTRINLERSLRIGDELGGHLVTGHIDAVGTIVQREDLTHGDGTSSARFVVSIPRELGRFVAAKGSISLDGTSLTVNAIEDDSFSVLIIPHTLAVTTWGERRSGDRVNVEVDLMARYAARLAGASDRG